MEESTPAIVDIVVYVKKFAWTRVRLTFNKTGFLI